MAASRLTERSCAVCGLTLTSGLHRMRDEWREPLAKLTGKTVAKTKYLCCAHFMPHTSEKYSKRNPLVLNLDMGAIGRTKLTRQSPKKVNLQNKPVEDQKDLPSISLEEWKKMSPEKTHSLYMTCRSKIPIEHQIVDPSIAQKRNSVVGISETRLNDEEWCKKWFGIRDLPKLLGQLKTLDEAKIGPKSQCSLEFYVMTFLMWLRKGYSYQTLASMCGYSESGVEEILTRMTSLFVAWRKKFNLVTLPSIAEWKIHNSDHLKNHRKYSRTLFMFVDGTVIEMEKPGEYRFQRESWNTKHQINSWSFFILVLPDGYISYISEIETGSMHDKTQWDQSDASDLLAEKYPNKKNQLGATKFAIGGDKAYPKMRVPPNFQVHITKSGDTQDTQDSDIHFSTEICAPRAVVERSIGAMKTFRLLDNKVLLSHVTNVELYVPIIANLFNWAHNEMHGR